MSNERTVSRCGARDVLRSWPASAVRPDVGADAERVRPARSRGRVAQQHRHAARASQGPRRPRPASPTPRWPSSSGARRVSSTRPAAATSPWATASSRPCSPTPSATPIPTPPTASEGMSDLAFDNRTSLDRGPARRTPAGGDAPKVAGGRPRLPRPFVARRYRPTSAARCAACRGVCRGSAAATAPGDLSYYQIVQAPGSRRALRRDRARGAHHPARRAAPRGCAALTQWNGDSRGRWDGTTLVVETRASRRSSFFMGADRRPDGGGAFHAHRRPTRSSTGSRSPIRPPGPIVLVGDDAAAAAATRRCTSSPATKATST